MSHSSRSILKTNPALQIGNCLLASTVLSLERGSYSEMTPLTRWLVGPATTHAATVLPGTARSRCRRGAPADDDVLPPAARVRQRVRTLEPYHEQAVSGPAGVIDALNRIVHLGTWRCCDFLRPDVASIFSRAAARPGVSLHENAGLGPLPWLRSHTCRHCSVQILLL